MATSIESDLLATILFTKARLKQYRWGLYLYLCLSLYKTKTIFVCVLVKYVFENVFFFVQSMYVALIYYAGIDSGVVRAKAFIDENSIAGHVYVNE